MSSANLPPLSLSVLGMEPLDEFIKEIADFVHHMIMNRPNIPGNVEVEAKIGVLKEKRDGGQRMALPVLVETILAPDSVDCRFESNMTAPQHKHFNTLLNQLKMQNPPPTPSPMGYQHLYLVDSFYPSEDRDKIRMTVDEKSGKVVECLRKIRLGDLNIYSPKRNADWRISVNLEVPVPQPMGQPVYTRRKDRMSYTHEECTIDLTQVTSSSSRGGGSEILHELELEISRPQMLLAVASKRQDPNATVADQSAFDELIRIFVNNARILVRNATESWH